MSRSIFHSCYHCKDRHIVPRDCHIDCKRYNAEVEENNRIRELRRKENDIGVAVSEIRENSKRSKNHKRRIIKNV